MKDLESVLQIASACENVSVDALSRQKPWASDELQALLHLRRDCRDHSVRMQLSKDIRKLARKRMRAYYDQCAEDVLSEFVALGRIEASHHEPVYILAQNIFKTTFWQS